MIQNLIKKAFGTQNVNEAASFLASACNRMKNSSKAEIQYEIEQALRGVNLNRAGGHHDAGIKTRLKAAEAQVAQLRAELKSSASKAKTKTVYQDNPELLKRLAETQSELAAARQNTAPLAELQRLNTRFSGLQRNLETEREHHYQELALLRETLQRKMDEQLRQTPEGNANYALSEQIIALQKSLTEQKKMHAAELAQLYETMQKDIDSQRALRSELVNNGNALIETVKELENQITSLKQQLQEISVGSNTTRTAFEQALGAHQAYISVLKSEIGDASQRNLGLETRLAEARAQAETDSQEISVQGQIILSLQRVLDETMETAENHFHAKESAEAQVLNLRVEPEQARSENLHNYSLCDTLSHKLEAVEAELSESKGTKGFLHWMTEK